MVTDAVTLEVARNQFASVADEMGAILRRTAYSPNIKERADCSAAVFVADGEMLAQAEHIPVHLGSMPASVEAVLAEFGSDVAPGVQFAVNDPFHGGTHLNDLTLVRPVHRGGRLIGWAANRAHHADVGGDAPGSMPATATRLVDEGHVVSPTVACVDGVWEPDFVDAFLAATRTPGERLGDLSAQLGANEAGAVRLIEAASEYGDAFERVAHDLLGYGESRMRAALATLGDGSNSFEDVMEWGDDDIPIRVTVTIEGDRLVADFAGTAPQIEGNINAVEAVTRSCLYYAVRVATDPTIPANGGCYRPLELRVEPGSLVAARPPVAVAAGNVETSQRIADVLLGALAPLAPARVPAASQGTMNNILIGSGGTVYYETVAGGEGGTPFRRGQSGIHTGMTNTKNTPIESLETHYPFRVVHTGLRSGSGGAGRHAGGEGITREIEFLDEGEVSLIGERRRNQPWGLAGGRPGATGEDWLVRRDGSSERLPGKVTFEVEPGDRVRILTPGGGGWGEP
ncbi:MAG TPA: hydantoinase B/oxoprolinase family protein [Acidimicrobiia bacterium]|nr:hydantoinase B/oxoprolinase family protein [Acidimicrobiia bacterium]